MVAHSSLAAAGAKVDLEEMIPDFEYEYNEAARQERKNNKLFKKAEASARMVNFNFLQEERKRLGL